MDAYTPDDVAAWLETMAGGTLSLLIDNPGLALAALALVGDLPAATVDPSGRPSPHFTWKEFLYSDTAAANDDISNVPTDPAVLRNIKALAGVMESVREICFGGPVLISSGYRSPDTNKAVGGAPDSAHLSGCACDFTVPEFGDVTAVVKAIQPNMVELGIDQLIHEGTWIHLGLPVPPNAPRYECFAL